MHVVVHTHTHSSERNNFWDILGHYVDDVNLWPTCKERAHKHIVQGGVGEVSLI